jgi:catechol 2,3-dioxygenase-like lactoylglutathione lyase family enzyme
MQPVWAQPQPFVRGIYNWIFTTGNAERAFPFYRDVFGISLVASPFYGQPSDPPKAIRPVAEAGADELVWNLTNTHGSSYRSAFLGAANTPFGLELVEFFDIPRNERPPNPWDPGASMLIFRVRALDEILARLTARGSPIVSRGAQVLETSAGRAILVRDPDGYLVQVIQASPREIANAADGEVIRTSIGITVASTGAAREFYEDLLGFDFGEPRRAADSDLQLYGLAGGTLSQTTTSIPGTDVDVVLLEFSAVNPAAQPPRAFRWRIQDVGAPQFQLEVTALDTLIERTREAGYRFLSVDAQPIQRPFGRFVFAIDPDGILVEFVEPSTPK